MLRALLAGALLLALSGAAQAHGCGRLAMVRAPAPSHAVACVAGRAAGAFQGFVDALAARGYAIAFMGGWRAHGSCRGCTMHPRGLAIDINQVGRNRVMRRLPAGTTELAARFGILHGAVWHHPDTGHFELVGGHRYGLGRLTSSLTAASTINRSITNHSPLTRSARN